MVLNFGHTIGHALEKLSSYRITHGYAVGYGILVEAKISQLVGILSQQDYERIQSCLSSLGIHRKALKKYINEKIIALTQSDKKNKDGNVRYVILEKIGKVRCSNNEYVYTVSKEVVKESIGMLQQL